MSNTRSLLVAMALSVVALPLAAEPVSHWLAGDGFEYVGGDAGWDLVQHRHFDAESSPRVLQQRSGEPTPAQPASGDFNFAGGDTGWQLVAPAFAWRNGRLEPSDPSREAARAPAKVTTSDTEEASRLYPGG